MKEFKNTTPRSPNLKVLPSSNHEENEKQRPLFTPPNFAELEISLVEGQILSILPKNDLSEMAGDKYESSVILPAVEGIKIVSKKLQDASESYSELRGCDSDLPALLEPPSNAHLKKYLTHEDD